MTYINFCSVFRAPLLEPEPEVHTLPKIDHIRWEKPALSGFASPEGAIIFFDDIDVVSGYVKVFA